MTSLASAYLPRYAPTRSTLRDCLTDKAEFPRAKAALSLV